MDGIELAELARLYHLALENPVEAGAMALVLVCGLAVRYWRKRRAARALQILVLAVVSGQVLAACTLTGRARQTAGLAGRTLCDAAALACDLKGGTSCILVESACDAFNSIQIYPVCDERGTRLVYCEIFERDEIEISPPPANPDPSIKTFARVDYLPDGRVRICDDLPFEWVDADAVPPSEGK